MGRINNPVIRRAQRLLAMVNELHKQGFQNLAIYPGMSPSGTSWRCQLTPVSQITVLSGRLEILNTHPRLIASYTSGDSGNHYFDWSDAISDSARELAEKFKERYPEIVDESQGRNWRYAGWFNEMLGLSELGDLPVAYDDGEPFSGHLTTMGGARLSLPPVEDMSVQELGSLRYRYVSTPEIKEGDDWHRTYVFLIDWLLRTGQDQVIDLPEYPVRSVEIGSDHLRNQVGAYWEGAIYFLSRVLKQDDLLGGINRVFSSQQRSLPTTEWQLFSLIWNNFGQLKWLKAHLLREKLLAEADCSIEDWEDPVLLKRLAVTTNDSAIDWLACFVDQHLNEGEKYPNPYFGGLNPLHLGLVLE